MDLLFYRHGKNSQTRGQDIYNLFLRPVSCGEKKYVFTSRRLTLALLEPVSSVSAGVAPPSPYGDVYQPARLNLKSGPPCVDTYTAPCTRVGKNHAVVCKDWDDRKKARWLKNCSGKQTTLKATIKVFDIEEIQTRPALK